MTFPEKLLAWAQTFAPVASILVIVAAFLLWKIIAKIFSRRDDGLSHSQLTTMNVIRSILKYTLIVLVILVVLQINSVKVGSLLAGLGIVGAIVGLALQDIIKDTIMGIHILTDSFFSVGDVIKLDDKEGIVRSFTLRTTKIELLSTHDIYVICNRNIDRASVTSRQVDIDVPLSYELDAGTARELMSTIAGKVRVMDGVEDCVFKGTDAFNSSSIAYKLRFWCNPVIKPDIRRSVMSVIQDILEERGIRIPYDQLDVHIPGSDA